MASVYEILTEKFIKQLEEGTIPWHKPWVGVTEISYSASTGKPYNILNQLLLDRGGWYYTYKQISDKNLVAPKGKAYQVFMSFPKKKKKGESDEDFEERRKRNPWSFSYYNVWHENDIEGMPKHETELPEAPMSPIEAGDKQIEEYVNREKIKLKYEIGNSAYYAPKLDMIVLPDRKQFEIANEFYSTAFHEIAHSTGHESRLARIKDLSKFGDESYSKEELVAEITSACMLQTLGIDTDGTFNNSAAYIQSWLKALKSDSRMICIAAKQSEKAVNYILKGKEN